MLSLAGIRVAPVPQDGASALLSDSMAQNQLPPSSASSLLLNPNGVSPAKRRSSRGGSGTAPKGPPRFSILRFLASTEGLAPAAGAGGDAATTTATAGAGAEAGAAGAAVSYGRGDLVEFTVVARRGQRQQSQRVGNVSLLTKSALPCR